MNVLSVNYVFFLVIIIFWLTNLLTLSVPDAEYSRNTSHAFNLISKYLFLINQKSCVVVLSLHFLYNLMKFVFKMLAFWTQNIHYSVIVLLYLTVSDPVKWNIEIYERRQKWTYKTHYRCRNILLLIRKKYQLLLLDWEMCNLFSYFG